MVEYSNTTINIVTALLVLLLGLIIANILNNSLRRFLKNLNVDKIIHEQLRLRISLEDFLGTIIKYLIYFVTIIIALNSIGVSVRVLRYVFLIFLAVAVVFVILAFKDFAPNLIAGFYILKSKKIKEGDKIKVNGLEGKVLKVNLIETKIETNNKEFIFIPNSNITKYKVIKNK